jgi:hypothetical protein
MIALLLMPQPHASVNEDAADLEQSLAR